jgi:hypothetical protein
MPVLTYPRPAARSALGGEQLQQAAGALSVVAGILLLLAVPLTLLIVGGVVGRSFGSLINALNLIFFCGMGAHFLLAIAAFWEGYRALRFRSEGAWTFIGVGVAAILSGIFLLGGLPGILAGVFLLIAGALVFSS